MKIILSLHFLVSQFFLVGIGSPDGPPSKQCGGRWVAQNSCSPSKLILNPQMTKLFLKINQGKFPPPPTIPQKLPICKPCNLQGLRHSADFLQALQLAEPEPSHTNNLCVWVLFKVVEAGWKTCGATGFTRLHNLHGFQDCRLLRLRASCCKATILTSRGFLACLQAATMLAIRWLATCN